LRDPLLQCEKPQAMFHHKRLLQQTGPFIPTNPISALLSREAGRVI